MCGVASGSAQGMASDMQGDKERAKGFKLRVDAPPRRKHMVFLGAAILADIMRGEASEFWVTRQEWQEDPHRALKKCDGLVAGPSL